MDSLIGALDSQTVLFVAAIAISLLLVTLLFRILKVGLGLILMILAIVMILQYIFGISPEQLWSQIANLPQDALQMFNNIDLNSLMSNFNS